MKTKFLIPTSVLTLVASIVYLNTKTAAQSPEPPVAAEVTLQELSNQIAELKSQVEELSASNAPGRPELRFEGSGGRASATIYEEAAKELGAGGSLVVDRDNLDSAALRKIAKHLGPGGSLEIDGITDPAVLVEIAKSLGPGGRLVVSSGSSSIPSRLVPEIARGLRIGAQ